MWNQIGRCATSQKRDGNVLTVTYHDTNVVVVNFDTGEISLNTDGRKTATTKRRMNQVSAKYGLEFYVYQENFEWNVSTGSGTIIPFSKRSCEFNWRTD